VAIIDESTDQENRQSDNLRRLAGPLLCLIQNGTTLDVVVNPDSRIWVNRLGSGWSCAGEFPAASTRLLLQGIARMREIPLNHANPILETIFPLTGDRIEGLISPVVAGAAFAIRTRQKKIFTLQQLKSAGILTNRHDPANSRRHRDDFHLRAKAVDDHLEVLALAARERRNVLLAGPTGSGKTSLANSLISEWMNSTPGDRVVILEDTPELQCTVPNHVQLLSTSRISQADLLTASLRLIPKRIVVGEIREPEPAAVLLNALNTGHSGGLATIHANDCLSALRKLEVLIGGHTAAVRERIADGISVVVFIDGDEQVPAGRKVREVMVVRGLDKETGDYSVEYV
jgi:Flp pilus assembly CpaF family ATPase